MGLIKRVWLKNAWRDKNDHIWTDKWSFEDEIKYRNKRGIAANQDRGAVEE